jgi:transcriptional regulator with XRE-family HTH domain
MSRFEVYTFGELLKGFRTREGLTQQELAVLIGRHRNIIGKWEKSEWLPKNEQTILALAEALNLSTAESTRLFEAGRYPQPINAERLPQPGDIVQATQCSVGRPNTWKLWASSEFSGGQCLTNEAQDSFGLALDASLYLKFWGTGLSIIYRQDTWYGLLTVEIDSQVVGTIDQKGPVKNQVEKQFEADSIGSHFLPSTPQKQPA